MGAPAIPYIQQTWTNDVSQCNAARNTVHEDGIRDAHLMPAVRAYHNTTQSINNATETTLAFNSERFDQVAGSASTQHDTSTNNSRLTALFAGVYLIEAHATWASNPSSAFIRLRLNGTTSIAVSNVATDYRQMHVSTLYALAVNDYVEVRVQQGSGGAININSISNESPEFMMVRVA